MEDLVQAIVVQARWLGWRLAAALAILGAFWIGAGMIRRVTTRLGERADPGRRDVVMFLGQTAKVAALAVGLVSALGTLGVDVSAMVAGLGLTGFALGFALRDLLANLLAGMLILVFRPFRREDRIAVTGFEGVVSAIDFRYTTLEAEDRRILIPNSILFTNPITLERRA